ncbi:MAG: dihydroneopterin aldolase [Bacillota bacterium]
MDRISLKSMAFYGYHGVLPEEKSLGQRFLVDVTIWLDLRQAAAADSLQAGVDYTEIYRIVKGLVEGTRFNLIETLAERIASAVLQGFPQIDQVTAVVTKPEAPIPGMLAGVAVEVTRRRAG